MDQLEGERIVFQLFQTYSVNRDLCMVYCVHLTTGMYECKIESSDRQRLLEVGDFGSTASSPYLLSIVRIIHF